MLRTLEHALHGLQGSGELEEDDQAWLEGSKCVSQSVKVARPRLEGGGQRRSQYVGRRHKLCQFYGEEHREHAQPEHSAGRQHNGEVLEASTKKRRSRARKSSNQHQAAGECEQDFVRVPCVTSQDQFQSKVQGEWPGYGWTCQ